MESEGWYRDPYGVHDDRWFSDGHPTDLVRDGGTEAYDAPPDRPFEGPLIDADVDHGHDAEDLRRADGDPGAGPDYVRAAVDGAIQGGLSPNG
jgi:hypothetical protein